MSVRTITVRLRSEVTDFKRSMNDAAQASDKMSARFDANGQKINTTAGRMVRSAEINRESWTTAGTTLTAFGAAGVAAFGLATKAAIDWESAFAGVIKTVDASADQILDLEDGLRALALQLPASSTEIADTAALLGQLGVQADSIVPLTKVMIDLGEATNLTAEEAATALARMANIMGSTTDDVARMGATIVDLGNNSATTEAEITNLALRMAAAGKQAGLSEANVFAFASALTSVGVEAEAGGTAMSKVITAIADAARTGNDDLTTFAEVAGVTGDAFVQAFEQDASSAVAMFVEGLGEMSNAGESTTEVFNELGLTDQRLMRAVLSLGSAQGLLTEQVLLANGAFEDNTALVDEANKRYETAEARIAIARNAINEAAITLGDTFLPAIADAADAVAGLAQGFASLPEPVQGTIAGIGGVASVASLAAGGFLLLFPRVVDTTKALQTLGVVSPRASSGLASVTKAAGPMSVALVAAAAAASGVDTAMDALTSARLRSADMDTLTVSMLRFAESGEYTGDGASVLADDFAGLVRAVDQTSGAMGTARQWSEGFMDTVGRLNPVLQSSPDYFEAYTEQIESFDSALASIAATGDYDAFEANLAQVTSALDAAGYSTEEIADLLPQATVAAKNAADAQAALASESDELATSTEVYNDLLAEQVDLQREAAGVALDEWDALTQYADALDAATDSLTENGATLDVNTKAGRSNRDALATIAESTWAWVEAGDAAGVSSDELATRMDEGRQAFIDAAEDMGVATEDAEALATQMGLVPDAVEISVSTVGASAVLTTLDAITARTAFINGNDVYVPVHTTSSGTTAYAEGGAVVGPGSGTSDSILARVSNGEHVWTANEVNAAGGHSVVEAMRAAALRGYATGGPVMVGSSAPNVTVNPSLGNVTALLTDSQMAQLTSAVVTASTNLDHAAFASMSRSQAGSSNIQGRLA